VVVDAAAAPSRAQLTNGSDHRTVNRHHESDIPHKEPHSELFLRKTA
jgi:hypothetical protein